MNVKVLEIIENAEDDVLVFTVETEDGEVCDLFVTDGTYSTPYTALGEAATRDEILPGDTITVDPEDLD